MRIYCSFGQTAILKPLTTAPERVLGEAEDLRGVTYFPKLSCSLFAPKPPDGRKALRTLDLEAS